MILGKPWLFRNNPAINFRTNEINIGGNETLAANVGTPSLDTDPMRHSEPEVELNFISGRQARHAMRNGEEGFMVWVTDLREEAKVNFAATRSEHSVPSPDDDRMANLQELLHEYRDTIPDELPAQLPPERQIDHEIDLCFLLRKQTEVCGLCAIGEISIELQSRTRHACRTLTICLTGDCARKPVFHKTRSPHRVQPGANKNRGYTENHH